MAKTITRLPEPPTTAEPQNFDDRADAFVGALQKFVTETNEVAAELEENLGSAASLKTAAQSSADSAAESAQAASSASSTALSSANEAVSAKEIAVSAAASAKQSEQVATSVKEGLQDSANALEEMKKIVATGFIDDTRTRTNLTYSSKKIVELNETLKTDVAQKLDQTGKEIRTAAMSGAMPSAYESDLAMWDYMEHSPASLSGKARFFKDWVLGVGSAVKGYTIYPGLDSKIKNNYYVSPSEDITAILDGSGEVIAAIAQNGAIYKQDGTMTYLNTSNSDGVSIRANFKRSSVAGKFVLYWLSDNDVAVFGLSGDGGVLKYLYKASVAGTGNSYVFHDVLVVNNPQAPQKTYKITNTGISEITGVELPASTPQYPSGNTYMPFYKDFLLSKNALIKADGTVKSIRICGEILGFLGGTPYLLQRIAPLIEVGSLYAIYDVESGSRCVILPLNKEPITAYIEDGYAYIVLTDGIIKIPAKYLTGANYKGE